MGACGTKPKVLLSESDNAPEQPKENNIVKEKEVVVEDVVKMEGVGDALKEAVVKIAEEKAVKAYTEVVPVAEDVDENGNKRPSLSTLFQEDKAGKKKDTEELKTETEVVKSDEPVKEVEETKTDETLAVAAAAEIVKEHTPIEAEVAFAPTTVMESNDEAVSSTKTVVVEVPKDDKPQKKEAVTSPTSLMRKPFEFIENLLGKKEEHVEASTATEVQSPKSPKVETLVQSPKSPKVEDAVQSPKSPKVEEVVSVAVDNLKQEPAVEAELPVVKKDSGKFPEAEPSK